MKTNKNNGCAGQKKTETDWLLRVLKVFFILHLLIILLISAIGMFVIYQGLTGKKDPLETAVIMLCLTMVQLIINAIRDFVLKNKDNRIGMRLLSSAKVMVPRGEFVNLNVKPETDLFEKGIIPTNALPKKECVFIVEVEIGEFKEAPVLILSSMYNHKIAVHKVNNGAGLSDMGSYMFNIIARSGESINFKFNSGGIVKKFTVNEFYIP